MAAGGGAAGGAGASSDGIERVLVLIEPAKEKRRADDKLPEEIKLDRPTIIIGRSVKADVQLFQGEGAQNTVSRKHAQLRVEGGVVKVEDLGSLNGLFVNRVKVLTAALKPDDLVQFGGAAGLKAGETLAPPSASDGEGGEASVGVGRGNAIVYRYVERPAAGQGGNGGGGVKGTKRGVAPAAATATAATSGGSVGSDAAGSKRRRVEAGGQGQGQEGEAEAVKRLGEEVKQLREALVGATQGAEGIFKALGMAPREGLGQAAKAVERAMGALAKVEEEKGKGRHEATELRKWKEKAESLTQQLKARDAELLAAEAKADALDETGKQALKRAQALEGEVQQQKTTQSALAARLEAAEKEKAALQAQLDEATAQRRDLERAKASLQEELSKAHALAAAATTTTSTTGGTSSSTSGGGAGKGEVLMKELRPELSCALCSGLLMDAAVMPCSHAFCFACLHPRLQAEGGDGTGKGKGGGSGGGDGCPICREPMPPGARPYRSTQLDTVVSIVADVLPAQERGEWERREEATQAYYDKHGGERTVCYGLRPLSVDEEEEGGGGGGGGVGDSVISPTQKPVGEGKEKRKKRASLCEGCFEPDHDYADCPHRNGGGAAEDEEEGSEAYGGGYGDEDEEEEEEDEGLEEEEDSEGGGAW